MDGSISLTRRGAVRTDKPAKLGATVPSVGAGSALIYELVLTAMIMAVATDTRAVGAAAAIAVGGTVALDAPFGGAVTGGSMNPARSFGPAVVVGLGLGAALGALAYQFVRSAPARTVVVSEDAPPVSDLAIVRAT